MNMINTSKEAVDFPLKQEGLSSDVHHHEKAKANSSITTTTTTSTTTSSTTPQWLKLKQDPRIVRVSRAFGGKDRHSKVCTIRGLRDRRVRLSVPTATHLYDLQHRLGLNQPSKVVDWLLNAAKHEIDELPPLPIIPTNGSFHHHPYSLASSNDIVLSHNKEMVSTITTTTHEKENWMNNRSDAAEEEEDKQGSSLPIRANNNQLYHPSFLGLLNTMPSLGGSYQLEPSHHDVVNAQLGNIGFVNQIVPFSASTLSLSTGSSSSSSSSTSQILVGATPTHYTHPYFPSSHVVAAAMENVDNVPRHVMMNNHYQMLMSTSSSLNNPSQQHLMMRMSSSSSSSTPNKLFHSPPNNSTDQRHSHKDQDFLSK